MAESRPLLCDWKCGRGLLIWWRQARPLKRRCHLQSHSDWHLQMTVWHLDPVHLKNKSDSFISPVQTSSPFSILRTGHGAAVGLARFSRLLRSGSFARGACRGIKAFTHTGPFESLSDICCDRTPCGVPAQGCFLTTPTLRWGAWMTLRSFSTVDFCTDSLSSTFPF